VTTTTLPTAYEPSLCTAAKDLPVRLSEWWMEPKMDGIRLQMVARDGRVNCYSRAGLVYNGRLPAVETAVAALDVVLDGEVVWFSPQTGEVDFHKGSGMFRQGAESSVRAQRFEGPLTYIVFDILELAGHDLRRMPIEQRRAFLAQLVDGLGCPQLQLVEQCEASPECQSEFIRRYREGVVLKKKGSTYVAGRPPTWLKIKVVADEDVVIMGMEPGKGKYTGTLGAVIFGQYRDGQLVRRGTCSGMDDATRYTLGANMEEYVGKVMVIRHMGTDGEGFRHPQYQDIRDDKLPEECVWS
jgi:ATP-dependent DNA ligase